MKNYGVNAAFLWSIIQAATAYGGWHSGGGELFTDASNPWFVQNTENIRYCLEIDEVNFGQDRAVAKDKIHAAFEYWKKEFQSDQSPPQIGWPGRKLLLATQTLVEVNCQEQHDVTFQFGVLSEEQARFLRFPEKVVAKSVRTHYDPSLLKGKGFIYVSPVTGPYALKGPGPYGSIMPNRWRQAMGRNLEMVLAHELGHIFGIQHVRINDEYFNLMAEDFPALIISWPIGYMTTSESEIPWFFAREKDLFTNIFSYDLGDEDPHKTYTDKILELPPDAKGLLELRPSEDKSKLVLVNIREPGETPRLIGTFYGRQTGDQVGNFFGDIYVTPAQNVFLGIPPAGLHETLFYQHKIQRTMTYIPARGGPGIPVGIETKGNVATFMTVYDNKFHFEFHEMRTCDPLKGDAPRRDPGSQPSDRDLAADHKLLRRSKKELTKAKIF